MNLVRTSLQILLEIALSAGLYMGFFYFNQSITEPFEATRGVNWIFLPAGMRIFIALIFNYAGAIGLIIASLTINYFGYYESDFATILGISIICGLAPLLGRHFAIHNLKVVPDLSNLTQRQLLGSIFAFSLLSSGLHQLWFVTRGLETGSWNHFLIMFFGDVVGSILLVGLIKYGIDLVKRKLSKKNLIE